MLAQTLAWWLVIQVAALIALPIAFVLFQRLPSLGYAMAKPLGLLLAGYLFWLALSLHLLPNRPGSIVWCFLVLAIVSALILRARFSDIRAELKSKLPLILAVEIVFGLSFAIAVYLRSFIPEISGTEKPMDFMLLNAASRSQFYPPDDAWLSGSGVSYYYFGYVIQAMLGKLAAVSTSVAFNLGLAGTAALAATAAFGLGFDLVRLSGRATLRAAMSVGAAAMIMVTVLGNLEGIIEFFIANGANLSQGLLSWFGVANLDQARESASCLLGPSGFCIEYPNETSSFWWWWRATRISPDGNSITEFPFFSFLLGDLHPHVMALPFVLLAVGLGLSFWRSLSRLDLAFWRQRPALLLPAAVIVGGLGFLNTWDLPTFSFVIAALVYLRNYNDGRDSRAALSDTAGFFLPLLVLAGLLYIPFYLSFSSQASGIETVTSSATRPIHSALFWTPLLITSLLLPCMIFSRQPSQLRRQRLSWAILLPLAVIAAWLLLTLLSDGPSSLVDAISARGWNWLTALFYVLALTIVLVALASVALDEGDHDIVLAPVLLLTATALLLILGAEFFYIRDVFSSRLNTVFKLYYQSWPLLALSGAYGLYWAASHLELRSRAPTRVWAGAAALVLMAALLYPLGATLSRTGGLTSQGRTLDGLSYSSRQSGDDYAILGWLNKRTEPDDVIVEATGGQYSESARVSSRTGVPTVLGWRGHEVQWGRDGSKLVLRESDVDTLYTTTSLSEAMTILRKYDVTYVFIGSLERAKYPAEGLNKFNGSLPVAFSSGQSLLLRVPNTVTNAGSQLP